MSNQVKPIPEGFHTITPYLTIKGAVQAIEFYKNAFDAIEIEKMVCDHSGLVVHAMMKVGDSFFMLSDEFPEPYGCGMKSPSTLNSTTVVLHLYVNDVDTAFEKAVKAGAKAVMPLDNMFWGDRYGQVEDPFGHKWSLATKKENLTEEETKQRAKEWFTKESCKDKC